MANNGTLPVLASVEIARDLSLFNENAQLRADASVLGGLAATVRADMPDRLIVVHPGELQEALHGISIPPVIEHSTINIRRHEGRYTTDHKRSGYIASEGVSGVGDLRKDLVVVTDSLEPWTSRQNTVIALRNHPYLNQVVRGDERMRAWLDRWAVLGGLAVGAGGIGVGGWANHEGVPYTSWIPSAGVIISALAFGVLTWTHTAKPRRAPMPNLSGFRGYPLSLVYDSQA